jgi:hypothetical protein
MNKFTYWASAMIIGIILGISGIGEDLWDSMVDTASAQDTMEVRHPGASPKHFLQQYKQRTDKDSPALMGPLDIVVGTSDKGANGMKYNNVPFVLFADGWIAFPNGNYIHEKPEYIITSNFTITFKPKKK